MVAAVRGAGFGRVLVQEYLREGATRGFRLFRLDVSAANHPAVRLYRALGFTTERAASTADGALCYLSLVRRGAPA